MLYHATRLQEFLATLRPPPSNPKHCARHNLRCAARGVRGTVRRRRLACGVMRVVAWYTARPTPPQPLTRGVHSILCPAPREFYDFLKTPYDVMGMI